MNSYFRTTLPTMTVIAMATLCCWPYLVGDDSLIIPEASRIPKLTTALTSELTTRNKRNPFSDLEAATKPEPKAASIITVETKDVGAAEADLTKKYDLFLTGLTLQATCISGRNRAAMINGDLYKIGDNLTVASSIDTPMQVTWIDENGVVLRLEDRSMVLGYSNQSKEKQAAEEHAAQAAAAAEEQSFSGLDDPASLAELFFRSVRMSEQLRAERNPSSQTNSSGMRTR